MAFDRPDNSISFLEKVASVQRLQHDLEARRMALDRQLNTGVARLDLKMAKQKSQRLEQYYRKICEDERRAAIRNEKIKEDLARAETRMQWMSQRSDRFKALKDEYEKMVERELPGWLEQLSAFQKIKKEKEANEEKRKTEARSSAEIRGVQPPLPPFHGLSHPAGSLASTTTQPTAFLAPQHPPTTGWSVHPPLIASMPSFFTQQQQQQQPQLLPHGYAQNATTIQSTYAVTPTIAPTAQMTPSFAYPPIAHVPPPQFVNQEAYATLPPKDGQLVPSQGHANAYSPAMPDAQNFPNQTTRGRQQQEPSSPAYPHQRPSVSGRQIHEGQERATTRDLTPKPRQGTDPREERSVRDQPQSTDERPAEPTKDKRDVLEAYQKTIEREDLDSLNCSGLGKRDDDDISDKIDRDDADMGRDQKDQRREKRVNGVRKLDGKGEMTTPLDRSTPAEFVTREKRGIISIPSANTEEDEDDDDDDDDIDEDDVEEEEEEEEEKEEERNAEEAAGEAAGGQLSDRDAESPRRSQLPLPPPPDSSLKPTAGGGDLAGTLDMLDSSLGSVDSTSLPDMSPLNQSANGVGGKTDPRQDGGGENSRKMGFEAAPAMGVKKKKAGAAPASNQNQETERGFAGPIRTPRSREDEEDDIFDREAKSDAKEKEDANLAYRRMMSTMKSESSTSRAVNTNKVLDSSSEDELENAIQKAVMGNKVKKEVSGSPPSKPAVSPRSPAGSKSQSISGSPPRSASKTSVSNPVSSKSKQQQAASRQTKSYQPKKSSTNFGMFTVGAKPGSNAGRPTHLRHAGSDSELDDVSSDDVGKRKGAATKGSDDDDFDFYG